MVHKMYSQADRVRKKYSLFTFRAKHFVRNRREKSKKTENRDMI